MTFDNTIHHLLETVLYQDEHGKNIVYDDSGVVISINDLDHPTFFGMWYEGVRVGNFYLKQGFKKRSTGRLYRSIDVVILDKEYQGMGLGILLYRVVLANLPSDTQGIYSYLPERNNKLQVPKIHRRLNAVVEDGDHLYIDKPDAS